MLRAFHTLKLNLSSLGQFLHQAPAETPRECGAERWSLPWFCWNHCYCQEGPLPLQTGICTFSAWFQFCLLISFRVTPENTQNISSLVLSLQGSSLVQLWFRKGEEEELASLASIPGSSWTLYFWGMGREGEGCSVNSYFYFIFCFPAGWGRNISHLGRLACCRAQARWEERILASPFSGIFLSKNEENFSVRAQIFTLRDWRVWHDSGSFSVSLEEVERGLRKLSDLVNSHIFSAYNQKSWYPSREKKSRQKNPMLLFLIHKYNN